MTADGRFGESADLIGRSQSAADFDPGQKTGRQTASKTDNFTCRLGTDLKKELQ
jgi:hypothetical protein